MLIFILESTMLLSLAATSQVLGEGNLAHVPSPSLTLSSCTPCRCDNNGGELKADCSNRNLKYIPLNLPATVVDINLDDNGVFDFANESSVCDAYKHLKKISLAKNDLKEVHKVFKGCEAVEEVILTSSTLSPKSLEKTFINLQGLVSLKGLAVSGVLERKVFSPVRKIKHLELSYNELSFPTDLFADLVDLRNLHLNLAKASEIEDAPLKTHSLKELYLSGPKIRKLPATFFSNMGSLTTLDLDLSHLNSLKWPDQKLFSSLKHLSIKHVWQVNANTLSGMTSLQTLQLSDIDSLVMDPDMFAQQKELEVLEITGCDLKGLPSLWLTKLQSLFDLNLTNNKLTELSPDALDGLSNLTNIDLSFNRIQTIPKDFLNPVADKLVTLTLNGNMLSTVHRDDFPMMNTLMALDVSKNYLLEFDMNISQQMPDLISLQIQHNSITNLTGSLGPKIQRVNASYNHFETVPDGLFVKSLIDLDLSGNPVTLPVDEIKGHENLKELTIYDMTVNCDCAMQQLIKLKVVHGGKCESDQGELNRDVGDIWNELLCGDTISTTVPTTVIPHRRSTTIAITTELESPLNYSTFNEFEEGAGDDEISARGREDNQIQNHDDGTDLSNSTSPIVYLTVEDTGTAESKDSKIQSLPSNNVTSEIYKTVEENILNKDIENTTFADNIHEEQNTGLQSHHSSQNVSKSLAKPSSEEHVKETQLNEENINLDHIVFPIVAILVVLIVVVVILMLRRVHQTGSHNLDHDRINMASEDPDSCKMVMTELGKTQLGHEIIVM